MFLLLKDLERRQRETWKAKPNLAFNLFQQELNFREEIKKMNKKNNFNAAAAAVALATFFTQPPLCPSSSMCGVTV